MGTIAARDCLRVLELTEQVCAAMLVAARQGVALRCAKDDVLPSATLQAFQADLEQRIAFVDEDRALDKDLIGLLQAIRRRDWTLYEPHGRSEGEYRSAQHGGQSGEHA
jgi:histidine ammonia-lyase